MVSDTIKYVEAGGAQSIATKTNGIGSFVNLLNSSSPNAPLFIQYFMDAAECIRTENAKNESAHKNNTEDFQACSRDCHINQFDKISSGHHVTVCDVIYKVVNELEDQTSSNKAKVIIQFVRNLSDALRMHLALDFTKYDSKLNPLQDVKVLNGKSLSDRAKIMVLFAFHAVHVFGNQWGIFLKHYASNRNAAEKKSEIALGRIDVVPDDAFERHIQYDACFLRVEMPNLQAVLKVARMCGIADADLDGLAKGLQPHLDNARHTALDKRREKPSEIALY